jgi:DNA polymerase III subunit gamma/tau
MTYQVLARKWRPQVFEDVVGQGHITRTLQNAISSNRLAHAFLFSGPRGVGKTTTARILAKALNCAQGPTPTPCGVCSSCLETAAGTSVDVIEIDGASNRGIEHIRELRETVKYAPVGGKHKVYVIDEVHMLTNEAFNALLKTLEEPPPHVIFIFATTEPQKIPATIHSRCQRYGFRRVALQDIVERLRRIAAAEGITISDAGLSLIARAAEGSMRDSQSLLDQAVSYSGMKIPDEDLRETLGIVGQERLLQFSASLIARDSAGLLGQVDDLLDQGQDLRQFLSGVIEHLRNLAAVKMASAPERIIELPASDIQAVRQQADGVDTERLLMLFDGLSRTLEELRWSPHQRFTLELGLIKACGIAPLEPLADVIAKIKELETRLTTGKPMPISAAPERVNEQQAAYEGRAGSATPSAKPAAASNSGERGDLWSGVMAAIKTKKPGLASALGHSVLIAVTEDELTVELSGSAFQLGQVEKPESKSLIEEAAGELLGRKVRLRLKTAAASSAAPKVPVKKAGAAIKAPHDNRNSAVQDVLRIFPQGELIQNDEPET